MAVVYACLPPTPSRWEALYTASRLTHSTQSQAVLGLSLSRMAADGHALHAKRTSFSSIHGVSGLWRLAHDVIEAVPSKRSRDRTHICTKQCQRIARVQGAVEQPTTSEVLHHIEAGGYPSRTSACPWTSWSVPQAKAAPDELDDQCHCLALELPRTTTSTIARKAQRARFR